MEFSKSSGARHVSSTFDYPEIHPFKSIQAHTCTKMRQHRVLSCIVPLLPWVFAFPIPQRQWQSLHSLASVSDENPASSLDTRLSSLSIIVNQKQTQNQSSWIPRLAYVLVCHFQTYLESRATKSNLSTRKLQTTTPRTPTTSLSLSLETESLTNNSFPFSTVAAVANATQQFRQELPPGVPRIEPVQELETPNDRFFPSTTTNQAQVMWNLTQDLKSSNDPIEKESLFDPRETITLESLAVFETTMTTNVSETPFLSTKNNTTVVELASTTTISTDTPSFANSDKNKNNNNKMEQDVIMRQAAEISHSFYAKKFRPAWFAKNPHLQTIAAVKARQESMYSPSTESLALSKFQWDHRQRMETVDCDFFDVDWKYASTKDIHASLAETNTASKTPIVLICHGLQSNTDSPLVKDMAIAFNAVGMDVAAINFRGCSGEPNRTPMGYHLSYTKDLEYLVQRISKEQPERAIYLSGFSLGANVVTKFLADLGVKAMKEYNIYGAAVNAVPFDLTKTQAINEPGFSGTVYGDLLVNSLKNRVLESMKTINYNFTKDELENCKTCKEFDDLVICSVYEEFENAEDYHRKSSTFNRLGEIMVPHFILQSRDDPFFVGNTNPENNSSLPCRIEYTDHGGHCGYVFHTEKLDQRESSFMPTELARFLEHVQQIRNGKKSTTLAWRRQSSPTTAEVENVAATQKQSYSLYREKLRRKQAAIATHSFDAREFVPAAWATNEHLQTIMGALFRRETMYIKNATLSSTTKSLFESFVSEFEFQWDKRHRMFTPDGDFFDVDWKYTTIKNEDIDTSDSNPIVLICHGLQSDSSSPLAQDMAQAFIDIGMDAACINFRGCSGEINQTPVGYHLGFTDDLKQMIEYVNDHYPRRRIYLSGFSLGANVVTSCLAELCEKAYDYNVFGAAVNAVPFDMPKAHLNLNNDGLTKRLYGSRLLASMVDRVEAAYDRMQFPFPKEEARKCRTIMDMENLVIAPIFGFKDAYDYYEKTSTLSKINQIAVPQLVIQAKDDPFFFGQALPEDDPFRPLRVQLTEHGGHCGYVFHSKEEEESYTTSWMPTELARFFSHLEDTFSSQVDRIVL